MTQELKRRYEALYGCEPAPPNVIEELEFRLKVRLPNDFKAIATFFAGGYVGGKSLHSISSTGSGTSIVSETERLRKAINLPEQMVVLAEPAASLIVMECQGSGRVLWIDAPDAPRLSDLSSLRSPQIWESYSSFFEELVGEEEGERDGN
jgi:hypothetical protein